MRRSSWLVVPVEFGGDELALGRCRPVLADISRLNWGPVVGALIMTGLFPPTFPC